MIVTAHQPNFLPGVSVIRKVERADLVIWLDEVQFSPHGWTNRNKLPSGAWLTVPVCSGSGSQPINRVIISEHNQWRTKAARSLEQSYPGEPWLPEIVGALLRPYRLLCGQNVALLQTIASVTPWAFQSHLDGGRAVTAVSDDRLELAPISERLALMVAEVGGTTYLSGPSGKGYLDEAPFAERGITVDYFEWDGPNPCVLACL